MPNVFAVRGQINQAEMYISYWTTSLNRTRVSRMFGVQISMSSNKKKKDHKSYKCTRENKIKIIQDNIEKDKKMIE